MPSSTDVPTFETLLRFASSLGNRVLFTPSRGRPFTVAVRGSMLYFTPDAGAAPQRRADRARDVLSRLAETGSMNPGDYTDDNTFNASYVLALVQAWRSPETIGSMPAGSPTNIAQVDDKEWEALSRLVRKAAQGADCTVRDARLVHGLEIDSNRLLKERWIGSIYRGENTPGNDIEIAVSLERFANPPTDALRVRQWVERAVAELGHLPARNHSNRRDDWFRAGFRFDDAMEFFRRLSVETDPMRRREDKWPGGAEPVPPASLESPEEGAVTGTTAALAHMLAMAKQACAQSGRQTTSVAKTKHFAFASDADFLAHVGALLERQGHRCAITRLPLLLDGEDDDECLPSLDRIDSDGHYAPENLQVVCRFVNRWKSDDSDANIRRLIQLLRQAPDDPPAGEAT